MQDETAIKLTNALVALSTQVERQTAAFERLERRLALQDARDARIVEVLERIESRLTDQYKEAV